MQTCVLSMIVCISNGRILILISLTTHNILSSNGNITLPQITVTSVYHITLLPILTWHNNATPPYIALTSIYTTITYLTGIIYLAYQYISPTLSVVLSLPLLHVVYHHYLDGWYYLYQYYLAATITELTN